MNNPKPAVTPRLRRQSALAVIAALALWCGQAKAQITVLDSDYLTMSYQGGIGSYAPFSQPATVSAGADALVVVLANVGSKEIDAEPTHLLWQGQTLKKVACADDVNSVWGDVAIYCLFKPTAGETNITGTYPSNPAEDWVSVFTLAGVSTMTAPLTGTAGGAANTNLTFAVTNVPDGAFAVLCGLWSHTNGTGLNLQAASGTMNAQYDSADDGAAVAMGTVSGLSNGTPSFNYSVNSSDGAAPMAFAGAVFYPVSSAPLSAANSTITPSSLVLPANGANTATITVQAVDTNGVGMEAAPTR